MALRTAIRLLRLTFFFFALSVTAASAASPETEEYGAGFVVPFDHDDVLTIKILSYKVLPPLEFDYPYDGTLFVQRKIPPEELFWKCGRKYDDRQLFGGCANPNYIHADGRKGCMVYLARESEMMPRLVTIHVVLRHEIGHCNGWPGDHRGAR